MNNKFDGVVGILGIAAGLVGVGYALGMRSKMTKIGEKLDRSIDELASNNPVDIPNDMIERAVEKAVSYGVKQAAGKATDAILADIKRDIHKQVSDVVESEYSNIKSTVLEELTTEAAKIDVNRVRSDVERAAKKRALEKFEENLDDITVDYKEYLASVSKIGKTFADAVAQPSHRETVLRIG
jgi:hypothetical protein